MSRGKVVRLSTASSLQEAHLWKSVLEREGISCEVVGDYLTTGLGVGHVGMYPEIWVHQEDLERARAVLQTYQKSGN